MPLHKFIDIWFWRPTRQSTHLINEMSGVFFPSGAMAKPLIEFIEESLEIESLSEELSKLRNDKLDESIVIAIRQCEMGVLEPELSDWDANLINNGLYPDPALDISFPLYKGYFDFSIISIIHSLLRNTLQKQHNLTSWLTELEKQIGTLPYKEKWKI